MEYHKTKLVIEQHSIHLFSVQKAVALFPQVLADLIIIAAFHE